MYPRRRAFSVTRFPYRGPPRTRTLSTPPEFSPKSHGDGTITINSDDGENSEENNEDSEDSIEVLFETGQAEAIVVRLLAITPLHHHQEMMELLVKLTGLHKCQ